MEWKARSLFLAIHVAAGFIALLLGPAAMMTAKGGVQHRRWGKVYFWAMAVVFVSAVVLVAFFEAEPFLGLIAVFSFYLAFSGYRVLFRKKMPGPRAGAAVDWIGALFTIASGLFMIGWGITRNDAMRWVLPVFGLIALRLGSVDLLALRRPAPTREQWWMHHLRSMLASYIAAVTAFSTINLRMLPPVLVWLWPTAVGTVGITLWSAYYLRRFRAQRL